MKSKLIYNFSILFIIVLLFTNANTQEMNITFPENHNTIEVPISYSQMVDFLESVERCNFIDVSIEGQSIENRSLYLIHLYRGKKRSDWKLFFFAQQHGNEPAGKDALIYLIKYISEKPEILPKDVDLWVMPMVNPDGAEANKRRNGNDFDLNRDHQLLSQPETQALHKVFRHIMPHVSVDCHEFTRDSRDYTEKGWSEWPLIMMDCANNPFFYPEVYQAGIRWCEQMVPYMNQKGHNYVRYYLGGVPPEGELRHSTPEVDDARNGLGAYGGLSFIIESGIKHNVRNPNADLGERIDAYLDIFYKFLHDDMYRREDIKAIERSRSSKIPDFIPINYFWANKGQKIKQVRVIEIDTGETVKVPTANFMNDLIVKNSVPTPKAYIISEEYSSEFKALLDKHAIIYEILETPKIFKVESCRIICVEDFEDTLYNRYAGRQIVERTLAKKQVFRSGSILVTLNQSACKRAALLLEPTKLYGLYQYPEFRKMVDKNNILPVYRIISD